MYRLDPVVFNDAWGSHVSLASLRSMPIPSARPESELWMGAHEEGPAGLIDRPGHSLSDLIGQDPQAHLGQECMSRFGARLPFLLKLLAPGTAISIQVHPTASQAVEERGRTGIEVYGDEWAKPELLLALAPFEVFVGLRSRDEVEEFIARLDVPDLVRAVEETRSADDPTHALLARVLATTPPAAVGLVRQVVAACVRVETGADEFGAAASAIVQVAEDHPDDLGIVVLVLMQHRVLQPGEFIDVAAGVLHSYVRGLGVEVLANSDNVVRAGLTAKPINVPEVLRIVDTSAGGIVGRPRAVAPGVEVFDSASDRFLLHRVDPSLCAGLPGGGSPRIVFVLRGEVTVHAEGRSIRLGDVESAFLPAHETEATVSGRGVVFVVSVPAG